MATPVQTQFTHVSVTMTQGNAVSPQVFGFALNSAMLTPHVSSETLPDPGYTPLASAPPPWHRGSFCPVSSSYHRLSHILAWSRHHGTQRPWFRWRKYSLAWHWVDATCTWDVNKLKHQKKQSAQPAASLTRAYNIHPWQKTMPESLASHFCLYSFFAWHERLHRAPIGMTVWPPTFFSTCPHIPSLLSFLSLSPHHPCHPSYLSPTPLLFSQWQYPGNGGLCFSWPGRLDLSGRISCPQTEGAAAAWQSGLTSQAAKPFDTVLFN